jgi:membrane fusion protein, multidrug efflux system
MTMDAKPAPTEAGSPARPAPIEKPAPPPPAPPPVNRHRQKIRVLAIAGPVVVIAGVLWYYFHFLAPYETTDDAFIDSHVILVSPRVPGLVTNLLVNDNQRVTAGDTLVEIDRSNYEIAVAQSRADLANSEGQLAQAQAQITVDEAKAEQQQAAVQAAEAQAGLAAADLKRYDSVESRAISASAKDLAAAQAQTTAASVEVSRNQAKAAVAQAELSRKSELVAEARVKQSQAQLAQAELNLSYTAVAAPMTGRVTQRTVESGNYVQTGQALLALVPEQVWVVANFKETQLKNMRPGQPATIEVDAYPGRTFKAHVDSIQAGTGARFGLLPPENAVGNYVKVVQRVPVKIVLDEPMDPQLDISPGMSVSPSVKVK